MIGFGQVDNLNVLNSFKYFQVLPFSDKRSDDTYGIQAEAYQVLSDKGLLPISDNDLSDYSSVDACDIALVSFYVFRKPNDFACGKIGIKITDCDNKVIYDANEKTPNVWSSYPYENCYQNWYRAVKKHFKYFEYSYNSSLNNYVKDEFRKKNNSFLNILTEDSARRYLNKKKINYIEGIWEYTSSSGNNSYRLFIKQEDYKYQAYILEKSGRFQPGDLKASFEPASVDEIITIKWKMADKRTIEKTIGKVTNNALIEFKISGESALYKVYPTLDGKNQKRVKNGEWAGNGSGIIISKSGHIITNHHVIEDADDIEVEFILDGEVQKFNAEIIQSDKVNDLAVIKILDVNFDGVDEPPYNFKTRSSDVGTKVYAFGYPMALSIMGKEMKVTDGIISSKTGYKSDITKYQITAPIQGGNSGGPLFDDKGNLIGINTAKLNVEIADNVGYSVKTSYVLNLIDILPKSIDLPSNKKLVSLPLTEQIKEISKYVVLVKVK